MPSGCPGNSMSAAARPPRERQEAEAKVLDILRTTGGKVPDSSTRKLSKMAGVRKSTMHMALSGLIAAGIVAKAATGALVLNG
jgi:DNA-binding IclR family transcriptional regulator